MMIVITNVIVGSFLQLCDHVTCYPLDIQVWSVVRSQQSAQLIFIVEILV